VDISVKSLGSPVYLAEIETRIASLLPTDTRLWGSLSTVEMICHLRGAYDGSVKGLEGPRYPGPISPGMLKFFSLNVPVKWPRNVQTLPLFESEAMPVPDDFPTEHERLKRSLDHFMLHGDNRLPHPYFGSMTPADWMRWGYLHADHHLRQFNR
jgi:hypothetical protein